MVTSSHAVSKPIRNAEQTDQRSIVLTVSASDSSGCAGMGMDIRTQRAMGVHTVSVVTANTAQTNETVISINSVNEQGFKDQLRAASALKIGAIKIGLLTSVSQITFFSEWLSAQAFSSIPVVIDPVLKSSSGSNFSSAELLNAYQQKLLPLCTLLTPNIYELEQLTALKISTFDDIEKAASCLLSLGAKAVLIKGGHLKEAGIHTAFAQDYFSDGKQSFWLASPPIKTRASRGTGCALSSVIASGFALGYSHYDAVVIGKMAISQGLRQSYCVDPSNYGPVNILGFPQEECDLPILSPQPIDDYHREAFPPCNEPLLGLYVVVDRASWIETLAPSGITTMQLRTKDLTGAALKQEIQSAIALAKQHDIRLFINDYWQLAIECGGYGVHLGQEDIEDADIKAILTAGLRLGLSTHCHYEVARAHFYRPSYIACGPVYHTNTKEMPWVPHGVAGLSYWRDVLSYPLVAIGGINDERFDTIAATGVDSIAMITAVTLAEDPLATAQDFIQRLSIKPAD